MKKTILQTTLMFTVLAITILAAHSSAQAQNGWIPPGSYQKSCKKMNAHTYYYTDGTPPTPYLSAICGDGSFDPFGAKGDPFTAPLDNFHLCDGDIWNDHGDLKCNKNPNSKLMQTARAAIRESWKKNFGGQPSDAEVSDLILQIVTNGYLPQFFKGLTAADVAAYISLKATDLNNAEWRAKIIKQAVYDAWGYKNLPPALLAKWDATIKSLATSAAGKEMFKTGSNFQTPYDLVLKGETEKISADKISKRLVVMNAYKAAVGSPASQDVMKAWENQSNVWFQGAVGSFRKYMYAPTSNGAVLLTKMYRNVLECHGVNSPTDDQVSQMIIKNSANKWIYSELCTE